MLEFGALTHSSLTMVASITRLGRTSYTCEWCKKGFKRLDCATMHERTCDDAPSPASKRPKLQVGGGAVDKFELAESALRGACQVYRLVFPQGTAIDDTARLHEIILKDVPELIEKKQSGKLEKSSTGCFKWYLGLKVRFAKAINPDIITDPPVVFLTHPVSSFHSYGDAWKETEEQLTHKLGEYEISGSGWIVDKMLSLDVTVCEMANPLDRLVVEDEGEPERNREQSDVYSGEGRYDEWNEDE